MPLFMILDRYTMVCDITICGSMAPGRQAEGLRALPGLEAYPSPAGHLGLICATHPVYLIRYNDIM